MFFITRIQYYLFQTTINIENFVFNIYIYWLSSVFNRKHNTSVVTYYMLDVGDNFIFTIMYKYGREIN